MTSLSYPQLFVTLVSLCAAVSLHAQPVTSEPLVLQVGGRTLKVPAPEGFVRCDGVNPSWDKAMGSILPASNRLLASFGTQEAQDLIRAGQPSDYSRNFNIQSVRTLETIEIGERTFSDMREEVKKELLAMRSKIDAEMKKMAAQGNKHMSENYGVDTALSISDSAMLGFFEESGTSIGFTMVMKVGVTKDGARDESRAVAACLMTPINGRLVNLYSSALYKGQADQVEVEKTVKAWRDSIAAVNPKVAGPAAKFDWENLVSSMFYPTVIGSGIGLLYGLFLWLSKKKESQKVG